MSIQQENLKKSEELWYNDNGKIYKQQRIH